MNESAPAPVPTPVPWWERVAAGLLVMGWAGWEYWVASGWGGWWGMTRARLAGLAALWQGVVDAGNWEPLVQWGSAPFAEMLWNASYLFFQVGIVGVVVAALWLASGRGSRGMSAFFWLAVLGHGLLGLSGTAAAGRQNYVRLSTPDSPSVWHGGWLEQIVRPIGTLGWSWWLACVIPIGLSLLMLWLGWRRKRRVQAVNALAAREPADAPSAP